MSARQIKGTIKDNVLMTCRDHRLPVEFAVYFLTLIELSGGDYMSFMPHPDVFVDVIERISRELNVSMSVDELPDEVSH